MFHGNKLKALTFSYDDGVTQDRRLVEILNKYQLKATFNINSALLGKSGALEREGKSISHCKIKPEELSSLYAGHEVAVHTLTHPLLTQLSEDEVIRQVEDDRAALEALCGNKVYGMAYPCGGTNFDRRTADIIKNKTAMKYARTIVSDYSFDMPEDLYTFSPTIFHKDYENINRIADEFLRLDPKKPALLYIWGHSYEFDIDNSWDYIDALCRRLSGREDIFYGTNAEVFGLV